VIFATRAEAYPLESQMSGAKESPSKGAQIPTYGVVGDIGVFFSRLRNKCANVWDQVLRLFAVVGQ